MRRGGVEKKLRGLREPREAAAAEEPRRDRDRPHPARGHPGGGPRPRRAGLPRCDAARRLTEAWERDDPGPRAPAGWGGALREGGLPRGDPGPLPSQLFPNCSGSGRLCVFVPFLRSARSPSQCPGAVLGRGPAKGTFAVGTAPWEGGREVIPSAAKQRQAAPASGIASLRVTQPSCAPARAHTHTHTRGALFGRTQLQERGGAKPPAGDTFVCSGSDDFRAVFCKLILLVSAQSAFNHYQNQTVWPAFQAASDTLHRDRAWPGQLAAKSIWRRSGGLPARPCWRPAPGSAAAPRPGSSGRGGAGSRAGAQSGLPPAASSAQGRSPEENLAGRGTKGSGLSAGAHSTLPLGGGKRGTGWGGGILFPAPTANWPGLRELVCEGSVAGGIRAASGPGCAGTEREPPGRPARPGGARVARAPLPSSLGA